MQFFGGSATAALLLGSVVAIPVLVDCVTDGNIAHVWLVVLAAVIKIVADVLFTIAPILDSVARQ